MQHEITKPSKLLTKRGELKQKGYATDLILRYNRKDVARKLRLKEWDYYLMYNETFGIAITVGTSPLAGIISATFIDFIKATEKTKTFVVPLPFNKLPLPKSSAVGNITYKDCQVNLSIIHEGTARKLEIHIKNFSNNEDLVASILLTDEPEDSMVIATPFYQSKKQFFYNQKIIGMRATGLVSYNSQTYEFEPNNAFGLLDWGRGVWPYSVTWYWSAAQGIIDNKIFGFNLGYGFGNTSAATENMLFYDGIASKLTDVTFIITKNKCHQYDYLKDWIITSSDNRIEMIFKPILDRSVNLNAILLATNQHQVFGTFTGTAILDGGKVIEIRDLLGFAERVQNRW